MYDSINIKMKKNQLMWKFVFLLFRCFFWCFRICKEKWHCYCTSI